MKNMKILASDNIVKSAIDQISAHGCPVIEASYGPEELPVKLREYDGLIVRSATKVTREVLEKLGPDSRLKIIVRAGVGLDNIDVSAAKEMGIEVYNTPHSSIESVAELALAHMIILARDLHRANTSMRQGEWLKKELHGRSLHGNTLGIIGLGRIGSALAARAAAFGMKVQYFKRSGPEKSADDYQYVDFDTLLSTSDFISLHVPNPPGSKPLIDKTAIAKMKDGAYLVNCARGGVVDESALLEALNTGKLAGAGLDVFQNEPPKDQALLQHEKVSLSPHIGASTQEAQDRIGEELIEIFSDFCRRRHG